MKTLSLILVLAFFSFTAFSQESGIGLKDKHNFEIEGLAQKNRYAIYYGVGLSYKYAFNHNFGIRQSLRYLRSNVDYSDFAAGKAAYSHVQYAIDGVYSFGKNKSWNFTMGVVLDQAKFQSGESYIPRKLDGNGLQLGLEKSFNLHGKNIFSIGSTATYMGGLRGGLRLGYRIN